jgi:hypothetical protein
MQTYVSPYLGEDFRKQDHIRTARVALEAEQNVGGKRCRDMEMENLDSNLGQTEFLLTPRLSPLT